MLSYRGFVKVYSEFKAGSLKVLVQGGRMDFELSVSQSARGALP